MGKSAPTPPDPKETSAAQTGTSVSTAIANAMMGNVNQITPDGSLTYDQTGSYKFTDPYTGHSYDVPRFTATQQLSDQQQATQDQTRGAQYNMAAIANDRSGFLKDHLGKTVDTSGVPGLMGSAGQSSNVGGSYSNTLGGSYNPAYSGNVGGNYSTALNSNTNFSGDIGGGYNSNFGSGVDGFKSGFSGDIGGSYNSNFGRSIGGGYDTGFNRNIGGSYSERLGPGYQTSVDLAKTYAGADDFSADRQRYEDALWQRGEGDRTQADEGLRTRLLNSGLREGSAAWNAEMERMGRQNTDARLATFLAGGDEQARMVNLARDAAIFGNQSTLAQSQFGNDALSNQFSLQNNAALNRANFASEQQMRQNAAALSQAQFGSQQQQLGNAASLGQAQFGSQQQQLGNAASMGLAQHNSQQQQLANSASLAQAQFGREGQQLSNAALQDRFNSQNAASMGLAQFGSQQQQLSNAALMDQFNAQNSASMGQAQFGNNANLTNAQFNNAARGQGMQEAYAARSQPINEIIGLMSGSQVQQPNFVNAGMPTIPTTDNAGLINNHYNQQMQQWQANQGVLGGIMGGVGSLIGLSDDDAKKDKKRLGDVEDEMGLWEFRYKGEPKSQPKHVGLMASEVEKVKPGAVKRGKDGLRRVDYGKALGLMGAQ